MDRELTELETNSPMWLPNGLWLL